MTPIKYLTSRGNQISVSVFLIGLGVCFLAQHIFPGVLYAIAVSLIVPRPDDRVNPGRAWNRFTGAMVLTAIGLMFDLELEGISLAGVVLVCIGLFSLFGALAMRSTNGNSTKNKTVDDPSAGFSRRDQADESGWNHNGVRVANRHSSTKPHVDRDLC